MSNVHGNTLIKVDAGKLQVESFLQAQSSESYMEEENDEDEDIANAYDYCV
jgi:hypothetical protein